MHKISKKFSFAYGHRVWSQSLIHKLSLDSCLACRHLHGHEGLLTVELEAEELSNSMVFDFKNLNFVKQFVDDYFDHKFLIDINDPLFGMITNAMPLDVKRYDNGLGYLELVPNATMFNEFNESFVIVDFVPTSENISKYMFEYIQKQLDEYGVKVSSVTFNETPKSEAVYSV